MKRTYTIRIPVTIEAADEESLKEAKQYLRQQVSRIEAGANHQNLVWSVATAKPKLITED